MASNLYFSSKNISRNKLYYRPRVCKESEGMKEMKEMKGGEK